MRNFEEICGYENAANIKKNDHSFCKLILAGGRPTDNIDDKDMDIIIPQILKNPYITHLSLTENDITSQGLKNISSLKQVKFLDLSNNYLEDEALTFLKEWIS